MFSIPNGIAAEKFTATTRYPRSFQVKFPHLMAATPKQKSVRSQLEALARALGPGAQMPPIRQLGADLGVSLSTLNAALSEMEDRNMIRRRQGSGIFVAPTLDRCNLCLICNPSSLLDFGESPFWRLMIDAARERAGTGGEDFSIHFAQLANELSAETVLHERLREDIARGTVHGVLSIGLPHSVTRWIEGCGVPVVSFAGASNYIIRLQDSEVVTLGVAALAGQGCRAIALWAPHCAAPEAGHEAALLTVFRDALAAHGLPYLEKLADPLTGDTEAEMLWPHSFTGQGFAAMTRLAASGEPGPDGIVSMDDMLTQGLLMARAAGGGAGDRPLRVATQANHGSPTLLGWQRTLTRIEFDPAEIIAAMFDVLESLLRGEAPARARSLPADPLLPGYHPPEREIPIHPRLVLPGAA